MSSAARYALFLLLTVFSNAHAGEAASLLPVSELSKLLFTYTEFVHNYQSGVTDSRANVMKKFDILSVEEQCPMTQNIVNSYRAELDAMTDLAVGRTTFTNAMERQFAKLNERERNAMLALFRLTYFSTLPTTSFTTWLTSLEARKNNVAHEYSEEYTTDEKVAGLIAIQRGIAVVTNEGNANIRSQGPKLYAKYKQQMLDEINRCIEQEEARLRF